MTPAEVLEKAADLIEANGLCKWSLQDGEGRNCSGGALLRADGCEIRFGFMGSGAVAPSVWRAARALVESLGIVAKSDGWTEMVAWNNHPERTATDVIDAMRHAAKDLRNEATP